MHVCQILNSWFTRVERNLAQCLRLQGVTPVTLCSGELWSILVVRLAHSADLRSRLRHMSRAPSVAYSKLAGVQKIEACILALYGAPRLFVYCACMRFVCARACVRVCVCVCAIVSG